MTFEKLKISVAVSLVIFIFVVGTVLVFGFLQKDMPYKPQSKAPIDAIVPDLRKSVNTSLNLTIDKQNDTPEEKTQPTPSKTTVPAVVKKPVIHTIVRRRTRAS